jgi:peroxiredoxin family protein
MSGPDQLSITVFSGGFDRVHYALVMASAAVAANRKATLFFTGRALRALARDDGWRQLDPADDGSSPTERDDYFAGNGLATFDELLEACVALGVTVMVCEMGLKALGLDAGALRADVPVQPGGVVTFLNDASPTGGMLFI